LHQDVLNGDLLSLWGFDLVLVLVAAADAAFAAVALATERSALEVFLSLLVEESFGDFRAVPILENSNDGLGAFLADALLSFYGCFLSDQLSIGYLSLLCISHKEIK